MNKIPLDLEPPSPMQPPPLRRRPSPMPQLRIVPRDDPSLRLFIDERLN